jgi:hypothetical protein
MTTESTDPQSEMGPVPANGQGQSQGHRRRRRRRKNKNSPVSAAQAQQPQAQPQEPSQSQTPPPMQQQKSAPARQGGRQGRHQNQNQGRKKKFFQKGSAAQPGNSFSGPPQNKRRGRQQKGPREFVGPMDHSYRAVNGNLADGPLSTIQIMTNGGRGNGGYYQETCEPQPTVAIREDAPTRIFCFIEDLFFLAKIQEAARKLGVKVEFVKGDKESVARLLSLPEAECPKLVVFDLNNLNAKPMTLIPKFKNKFKKAVSIIGFLNHLQSDLKAKAVEVGCDTVMPRAAFSQSLPTLLRRYGVEVKEEEEEEDEYAQQLV